MSIGSISGAGGNERLPIIGVQGKKSSSEKSVAARKSEEPEETELPEPQPLKTTELLEQIAASHMVAMSGALRDPADVVRKRGIDAYRKQSVADIPSMSPDAQSDSSERQWEGTAQQKKDDELPGQ